MEECPARPQSDGVRLPPPPPGRVALGGTGDEDPEEKFLEGLRRVVEESRRHDFSMANLRDFSPETVTASYAVNAYDALSSLSRLSEGANPEVVKEVLDELRAKRTELQDQLELERLVQRPARKGFELIRAEDDLPKVVENAISLIDSIIETLERGAEGKGHNSGSDVDAQ